MKRFRKFIALCLVVCLCLSYMVIFSSAVDTNSNEAFPLPASVGDEAIDSSRMAIINENVTGFLKAKRSTAQIQASPIVMYNLNNTIEAIYYVLLPEGYLIASYGDGHVIEYSPNTSRNIIKESMHVYYNGPFEYYYASDNGFTHTVTLNSVNREDFASTYHIEQVDPERMRMDYSVSDATNSESVGAPINYVGAYEGGYYCTITGISNLLQWYVDYKSADMYALDDSNITEMRYTLNHLGYIYNGGLNLDAAVAQHLRAGTLYHGLSSYLNRDDVDTYETRVVDLLEAQVQNQIQIFKRPVLLTIDTRLLKDDDGRHIVLAYKYEIMNTQTYYYVNDGWDSNEVEICASDIPETYEMMFIR